MRDVLTAMIKAHEIQGVHRAREQLQPRRPRPRRAGARSPRPPSSRSMLGLHARRRSSTRCRNAWVDGQRLRTYRHAPNTGSRKSWAAGDATVARRAPRADRADRRDGLSVGADREDLGLLRRAVQGQAVHVPAAVRQLRDGERAVQDQLPGRVPRADRGRVRDAAASARSRDRLDDIRADHDPHARVGDPHHRQDRARSPIPPTATTASSTWSPCR